MRKPMLATLLSILLSWLITTTGAWAQENKVTLLIHPTVYNITGGADGVIADFEKKSGIKVEVVTQPLIQLHEKAVVEWLAGSGRYDVVTALDSYLDQDIATQYLEPLDDRLAKIPSEYDLQDVIPSLFDATRIDGKTYGLPFQGGAVMLFYRKDLFEKYGIAVPRTFEELESAARALTKALRADGNNDTYALGFRAKEANVGTQDFLVFFFAAGGNLFENGRSKCGLNTPAGVAAAKLLATFKTDGLTPPDLLAMGRDELIGGFQQGRLAMAPSFAPYYAQFNDPKDSKVKGNVGWSVMPTLTGVPEGRSFKNYWHMVLDKNSKNKDAAWQLMLALAEKDAQTRMAANWGFGPVRQSAFDSPEVQKTFPHAADWAKAASASTGVPQHPEWPRIQDAIFEELAAVLNGAASPEDAVAKMCDRIDPLLAK
jgi:multiple sugar transport system substrate-binding protein